MTDIHQLNAFPRTWLHLHMPHFLVIVSWVGMSLLLKMMKWYMKWIIYELRIWNQVKLWPSQLWAQFLQLRREAWKIQDFNGVWTRDLAIPARRSNQLSYKATDVGSLPWGMIMNQWWNGIWNESYMNCRYEIKWSYVFAVMSAIFAIA